MRNPYGSGSCASNTIPGPGAYRPNDNSKEKRSIALATSTSGYQPVVVQCFFKGANKCSLCGELQYGDYYQDGKKRPLVYCVSCFRLGCIMMTTAYLRSIKKCRHCCFVHKHIDVENIVHNLITPGRVRHLALMEKAMWSRFPESGKTY